MFWFQPVNKAARKEIHGLTVMVTYEAVQGTNLRQIVGLIVKYYGMVLEIEHNQVRLGGKVISLPHVSTIWSITDKTPLFTVIQLYEMTILYGYSRVYIRAEHFYLSKVIRTSSWDYGNFRLP